MVSKFLWNPVTFRSRRGQGVSIFQSPRRPEPLACEIKLNQLESWLELSGRSGLSSDKDRPFPSNWTFSHHPVYPDSYTVDRNAR